MFHFSIRDLCWLTIVVALAVGWIMDRSRQAVTYDDNLQRFTAYIEQLRDERRDLEARLFRLTRLKTPTGQVGIGEAGGAKE